MDIKFRFALILVNVLVRLTGAASVPERLEDEARAQAATVDFYNQRETRTVNRVEHGHGEEYHEYGEEDNEYGEEDNEHSLGMELPRVAFSSRPRDGSVGLAGPDRTGPGRRRGLGRKRNPCLRKYEDYCIHGTCQYLRELRVPACICQVGYSGHRCHLYSLAVSRAQGPPSRTVALVMGAVLLALLSVSVVSLLMALRYGQQGAEVTESQEETEKPSPDPQP